MSLISEFNALSEKEQYELLLYYQDLYESGEPEIDDATFDTLVSIYEKKHKKKFSQVGAEVKSNKIQLPYYMGSLDKIKGANAENELNRWVKKYSGPWILEDKMDGISALYIVKHIDGEKFIRLYTRGDGVEGSDITHLLQYISIPIPSIDIVVRGELIIKSEDFINANTGFKNARNTASGLVNSKDVNVSLAKLINFYAYNIIDWEYSIVDKESQMSYLSYYNFNTPWYIKADTITVEALEEALKIRKQEAPYEIDGLVITDNKVYELETDRNPKYAIAFKVDQYKETIVTDVIWEASKDGIIKPVVIYEPVEMSGVTMSRASGKNAKFIVTNKIGPGAVILVTRAGDVIPDIVSVIEPAKNIKLPAEEYRWNANNIEFVLIDKENNEQVQKERIEYFIKTTDIKNVGPGRIALLYDKGFNTIYKLLSASPDEMAEIEGLGFKSADQIYSNIQDVINNAPLSKVMAGSGVFGPGFGVRRMELVIQEYPDILSMSDIDMNELTSLINDIEGFDKTSEEFAINLPLFVKWLHQHPMIKIKNSNVFITGSELQGEKIVFTGFRNSELENKIKEQGGSVASAISKSTTILVAKNLSDLKTKGDKARELGIKIMNLEDFKKIYKL